MARLDWKKNITNSVIGAQRHTDRMDRLHRYDIIKTKQAMIKSGLMCFGKYTGKEIKSIPIGYLRWAKKNVSNVPEAQKQAIQKELEARNLTHKVGGPANNSAEKGSQKEHSKSGTVEASH